MAKPKKNRHQSNLVALVLVGAGFILLAVVALLALLRTGGNLEDAREVSAAAPAQLNLPAPELELVDLQGNPVALADYRGQVVLVNNWATWCPPCKAEMPVLQAFFEDYQAQGFTVIAVEAGEPTAEVAEFATSFGLSFPVWPDPRQQALSAFRNANLPSSYVIDRQGRIRLAWTGIVTRPALETHIIPLLEEGT
jgi:peroxiredoxin